jgi:hypothetical protein
MDPASTWALAEIAAGVSKEGMTVPSSWVFAASLQVGRDVVEVMSEAGWAGGD